MDREGYDDASDQAVKPHFDKRLLRFDFKGDAVARLHFTFGVHEDGVWTPIKLPWMRVTLTDSDCGTVAGACERRFLELISSVTATAAIDG